MVYQLQQKCQILKLCIVSGLAAMRQYIAANSQESASQIGYLITTSASQNVLLAESEAKALAKDGVQLMVLGIGSDVSATELNSLEVNNLLLLHITAKCKVTQ